MYQYREDYADIELESGTVNRTRLNKAIGEGDNHGNRYGVRVFRDGEAVDLTGVSCDGYFMRADGTATEVIAGVVTGNIAYVALPAACYAVVGNFTLAIKLIYPGYTMTARIVDGTVVDTKLGELTDPGDTIPDLSDFTALVARVEAAAAKIESFDIEAEVITGTRYRLGVIEST